MVFCRELAYSEVDVTASPVRGGLCLLYEHEERSQRMKCRFVSVMVTLAILACCRPVHAGDRSIVAKVNGVGISQEEFDRDWTSYLKNKGGGAPGAQDSPERVSGMKQEVLDALIGRELLWQEAQQKKIAADQARVAEEMEKAKKNFPSNEEYVKRLAESGFTESSFKDYLTRIFTIQRLIEAEIAKGVTVSDKDVHDFYVAHPEAMRTPEQVHARHILVKVDPKADAAAKEAARKKIEGILKEAKGGADFAELAKKYSDCPSKEKGGDLGSFQRGQMVKPFEEAAFSQKPGTISGVVETEFGYHIIKVEERTDASTVPEKEVSDRIREFLKYQKTNQAVTDHVRGLREKAKVEILKKL
jgi:peptidyl-prolyl cis-trans isomerase C